MFGKFNVLVDRWVHHRSPRPVLIFAPRTLRIGQRDYLLRQATLVDVAALVAIEAAIYGTPPWNAAAFNADLKRTDRLYLVMKDVAAAVGLIGLAVDYGHRDGHVTNLAVLPSYQHRGLGRNLLRAVAAVSRAHHLATMSLEVRVENVAAQQLYAQMGYVVRRRMHRYYLPDGGDAFTMVAPLELRKEENL